VGLYSLVAASVNPKLTGWAFEPVPASYPRLRENLDLNGLGTRIIATEAAVADSNGTARLFIPGGRDSAAPSSHLYNPGETRAGDEVSVKTVALDAIVPGDTPVDLVKIDVEGAEEAVLKGATQLLARWRPVLFIEFLPWIDTRYSVALLRDLGYKLMLLSPGGAREVQSASEQGPLSNFLCLPPGR
jgi:FkbM family methyltransferase